MDDDLKLVERLTYLAGSFYFGDRICSALVEAAATITRLHASRTAYQDTIDGLVKERDTALFQAESIANYTAAFYGPPENWKPMTGDLNGLLSQISNAVTGLALASRAETAEAQRDAALEALPTTPMEVA